MRDKAMESDRERGRRRDRERVHFKMGGRCKRHFFTSILEL